jgi:hypothetical protein
MYLMTIGFATYVRVHNSGMIVYDVDIVHAVSKKEYLVFKNRFVFA